MLSIPNKGIGIKLSLFQHFAVRRKPSTFAAGMRQELNISTRRGSVLNGVLFASEKEADTVLIAITGIHGNFYSNPFYYNIGDTLSSAGIDFIYAQTCDAFGFIETENVVTGQKETIGSWNEDFQNVDDDLEAYLSFARTSGYKHIVLAGHSLGANKVLWYLSRHHDAPIDHFLLLSPANLDAMMRGVTSQEKDYIRKMVQEGRGEQMLPFYFMGWVECVARTAWQWLFTNWLNNVHLSDEADWSVTEGVRHTGALLIGTYDNFAGGDPVSFLERINRHIPTATQNKLIFIEKTGHTYQMKHQEVADDILKLMQDWS